MKAADYMWTENGTMIPEFEEMNLDSPEFRWALYKGFCEYLAIGLDDKNPDKKGLLSYKFMRQVFANYTWNNDRKSIYPIYLYNNTSYKITNIYMCISPVLTLEIDFYGKNTTIEFDFRKKNLFPKNIMQQFKQNCKKHNYRRFYWENGNSGNSAHICTECYTNQPIFFKIVGIIALVCGTLTAPFTIPVYIAPLINNLLGF